eukprot:gene26019-32542_t
MLLAAVLLIGYSATSPSVFNLRVSKASATNLKTVKVEVLDPTTCTATTSPVLAGTDVTSFLKEPSGNSKVGSSDYTSIHNEYVYYFETDKAKALFDSAPEVYIPQYGGFSAWEVAKSSSKIDTSLSLVDGDRNTADHKLYLFADADTKASFSLNLKQNVAKADANWVAYASKMNTGC